MSRGRQLLWCFWIFVIIMLLWQAYTYNERISRVDPLHPTQTQFFFIHTNAVAIVAKPIPTGAFVEQSGFTIEDNMPSTSSFTCHVTLKNTGKAKAINVSVQVRPYRGTIVGDVDMGRTKIAPIDDTSSISQLGQWVSFPDLAPGESSTETAVFLKQAGATPGKNPSPQIIFETEKKK